MNKFLFIVLVLFSNFALAGQEMAFKEAKPSDAEVYYTVYQGNTMADRDADPNGVFHGCKKANAATVIRKEKLAYDRNITGAFYCMHPHHQMQVYIIVKKFTHWR